MSNKKKGEVDLSIIPKVKKPTDIDRIAIAIQSVFTDSIEESLKEPYCTTAGKVMMKLSPPLRDKVENSRNLIGLVKHNNDLKKLYAVRYTENPNTTVRKSKLHIIILREKLPLFFSE